MSQVLCNRCVMDKSAEEITFTKEGCNFCTQAQKSLKEVEEEASNLPKVIKRIKKDGHGKQYDVLIGISGGVDSGYALHCLTSFGLRPLVFSMDNGWNDPKADENIMRLVEGMKVPFYRYVIDQKVFKKLQGAFLKSGTKNLEIPTDHVLTAAAYELADRYNIKWIVSGGNVATESIMPESWGYQPRDLVHIKAIYEMFNNEPLKGLPVMSLLKYNYYKWIKKIKTFYILDYLSYNRKEAIKVLEKQYGYIDYGAKHEENVYTSWFQNFYLFEKWGIDKRKAHLSSLIVSGQLTRKQALHELTKSPVYPKLGIEEKALRYPKHDYRDYPTDEKTFAAISKFVRFFRWYSK